MAEVPAPVGYWCDHTDEPRDARTHEGWDLTDTGQEWTRQPDTISSHTGTTDWDRQQRRCPKAVPVYAVDAPALVAQLERLTADLIEARRERDAHAHLLEHWADQHIILQVVSGDPVHAAWCYRCRIEKAETTAEQLRTELAWAKDHAAQWQTVNERTEAERDAALAELEERGNALADWQRAAGQHQAAMFDAKTRAEQLDKAVTFLTEVLAGTVLVGADDAIGMLHELVTVLVDLDELTADQAARVKDGLDAQRADRDQLRQLVRDLTDPDPCYLDHHGGCQTHGYLSLKPGEKCPHAEAKELLGVDSAETEAGATP